MGLDLHRGASAWQHTENGSKGTENGGGERRADTGRCLVSARRRVWGSGVERGEAPGGGGARRGGRRKARLSTGTGRGGGRALALRDRWGRVVLEVPLG